MKNMNEINTFEYKHTKIHVYIYIIGYMYKFF